MTRERRAFSPALLTRTLKGQEVLQVITNELQQLVIRFTSGTTLVVDANSVEVHAVTTPKPQASSSIQGTRQPTRRQFEYLTFIAKYIARFGISPAESDIERHFLVSAPSVNQMMQTLERCGFISRQRGVPRSIRICIELSQHTLR